MEIFDENDEEEQGVEDDSGELLKWVLDIFSIPAILPKQFFCSLLESASVLGKGERVF
jgi:hypothetical protein